MRNFFQTIERHGIRRAFLLFIVKGPLRLKALLYKVILSDAKVIAKNLTIIQPSQFIGKGRIELKDATIGIWPSPGLFNGISYFEARSPNAVLKIGAGTFLNNNATVIVDRTSIIIGENCLIGPNFFVADSDFHGLCIANRTNGNYECKSVIIEDNVFIGEGVRILKGVTIGFGAVIGAGSLVTKDVAPNTLVAGVPANKISGLDL